MILEVCERCKQLRECDFYGRPASVDEQKAQNGEWLCCECTAPRLAELDEAIKTLEGFLEDSD